MSSELYKGNMAKLRLAQLYFYPVNQNTQYHASPSKVWIKWLQTGLPGWQPQLSLQFLGSFQCKYRTFKKLTFIGLYLPVLHTQWLSLLRTIPNITQSDPTCLLPKNGSRQGHGPTCEPWSVLGLNENVSRSAWVSCFILVDGASQLVPTGHQLTVD